jgi:hypothetical protein
MLLRNELLLFNTYVLNPIIHTLNPIIVLLYIYMFIATKGVDDEQLEREVEIEMLLRNELKVIQAESSIVKQVNILCVAALHHFALLNGYRISILCIAFETCLVYD